MTTQDRDLQTCGAVTSELIAQVVRRLSCLRGLQRVILFGSCARGQEVAGSDIDLLIVHDGPASNRQVRREIERMFWNRRFGLDLIVRRPEEVERNLADGNPLYTRHILREGRVLYDRGAHASS